MFLLLFILLVAMVVGLVGALAKGLLWLLAIGVALFVAALFLIGIRLVRGEGGGKYRLW